MEVKCGRIFQDFSKKLIGEDFEWDFDKLEDENKVTPETLYTFQTVYNLILNLKSATKV